MTSTLTPTPTETDDLLEALATHRRFLRFTVAGLTDAQARTRATVSELHLAGLVEHVTRCEAQWTAFCQHGVEAFATASWAGGDPETPGPDPEPAGEAPLTVLLDRYAAVAACTEEVVRSLDLDLRHELPTTPWWPQGGTWSVRRALVHVIAETAQHAGHADILRETIDGQKTMG